MRKKILYPLVIITMVLFAACSNEELLSEATPEAPRTLALTASMPDKPTTRITLEEDDGDIALKWVVGDILELAFVQDTIPLDTVKIKQTTTVTNVSLDGKKAQFNIIIPAEIDGDKVFNLYGVYGGGGLDDDNPTVVILSQNAGNAGTLSEVEAREDVMLYFSAVVDPIDPQISVTFQRLGSLFSITFLNNGLADINNLQEIRIRSANETDQWAYNTEAGGQIYCLVNEIFLNQDTGSGYYIYFNASNSSFPIGVPTTLWGWYPPLPGESWPELYLAVQAQGSPDWGYSQNSKPVRATPPVAGKNYRFYATWDGTNINFTDSAFNVTP